MTDRRPFLSSDASAAAPRRERALALFGALAPALFAAGWALYWVDAAPDGGGPSAVSAAIAATVALAGLAPLSGRLRRR